MGRGEWIGPLLTGGRHRFSLRHLLERRGMIQRWGQGWGWLRWHREQALCSSATRQPPPFYSSVGISAVSAFALGFGPCGCPILLGWMVSPTPPLSNWFLRSGFGRRLHSPLLNPPYSPKMTFLDHSIRERSPPRG